MALLLFLAPPVALVTGCRSKAFSMLGRGRMGASLLPQGHGEQFAASHSHEVTKAVLAVAATTTLWSCLAGIRQLGPSTRSPGDGG